MLERIPEEWRDEEDDEYYTGRNHECHSIRHLIKIAPSVTPIERTGEWVDRQEGTFCSECDYKTNEYHNFCPNCGAKMGGDKK